MAAQGWFRVSMHKEHATCEHVRVETLEEYLTRGYERCKSIENCGENHSELSQDEQWGAMMDAMNESKGGVRCGQCRYLIPASPVFVSLPCPYCGIAQEPTQWECSEGGAYCEHRTCWREWQRKMNLWEAEAAI